MQAERKRGREGGREVGSGHSRTMSGGLAEEEAPVYLEVRLSLPSP